MSLGVVSALQQLPSADHGRRAKAYVYTHCPRRRSHHPLDARARVVLASGGQEVALFLFSRTLVTRRVPQRMAPRFRVARMPRAYLQLNSLRRGLTL